MKLRTLRLIFLLSLLVFLSACSTVTQDESIPEEGTGGMIKHEILSPLGNVIEEQEATFYAGTSKQPSRTIITSRYADFGLNYDPSALATAEEPYCRVGGQYVLRFTSEIDNAPDENTEIEVPLYYCKTTEELMQRISIPSSWASANLVLYCNDGSFINFENVNFDVFSSEVSTYKACVLRNLDLEENNAILYGYEVGNMIVDDDEAYYFNSNSLEGQVTHGMETDDLNVTEPPVIYYDDLNNSYIFEYDASDAYYALRPQAAPSLDMRLGSVFTTPSDFDLSRVALFRSFSDGRKVYGYEKAASLRSAMNTNNTKPVYKVDMTQIAFTPQDCERSLASYGAINDDNLLLADSIACTSTGYVLLNSIKIDSAHGVNSAFNIFKNIILDIQ